MKLYGKTLWLKRGVMLQISLTYSCPFHCSYCSLKLPTGQQPKAKPIGLEDWKRIITNFPVKIKEVYISGGEPTLISWLPDLCNWLLDEGYHVTIFSNLWSGGPITFIKESHRLQVWATFHHEQDMCQRFDNVYNFLINRGYNVVVGELGEIQLLPYSKMQKFTNNEELKAPAFRYSPDGHLYTSCYEHYKDKS